MENKTPTAVSSDTQAQKELQPFVYDAEVCEDIPPQLRLAEEKNRQAVQQLRLAEETTRQTIQLLNFIQQQMNHTVINKQQ